MGFAVTLILLIIGIWLHHSDKTWISPECFFSYYWSFTVFGSSLHLFDLYEVQNLNTWFIILIGSLSFIVGSKLTHSVNIVNSKYNYESEQVITHKYFFSPTTFWIIIAILYIFAIKDFLQAIRLMRSGVNLSLLRSASYGLIEINNYSQDSYIVSLVLQFLRFMIIPTGIQFFVSDFKKNYLYLISVILLITIISLSDGGRSTFVYFLLQFILCILISNRNILRSIPNKIKKILFRVIVIFGIVFVIISSLRGINIEELLKSAYMYVCGNVIFFDLHITALDHNPLTTYGFCGLYGVVVPFFGVISRLVNISYPQAYYDAVYCVNELQNNVRFIGTQSAFNSYCTPFYYPYVDFGWFGVIVEMFVFGLIVGYVYRKACVHKDGAHIVPYLFSMQTVYKAFKSYPGVDIVFILIACFMLVKSIYENIHIKYTNKN